jgi:hypothetical protein
MDDFIVFSDGRRAEESSAQGQAGQNGQTSESSAQPEAVNAAPTPDESPTETVNPDDIPF